MMEIEMVEESERIEKVLVMEETSTERVSNEQPEMGRLGVKDAEGTISSAVAMEIEENDGQKLAVPSAEAKIAENNERIERVLLVGEVFSKREEFAVEEPVKMVNSSESMERERHDEKKLFVSSAEKKVERGEPIIVEILDTRGQLEMIRLEEIKDVIINHAYPEPTVKIRKDISTTERKEIIDLL